MLCSGGPVAQPGCVFSFLATSSMKIPLHPTDSDPQKIYLIHNISVTCVSFPGHDKILERTYTFNLLASEIPVHATEHPGKMAQ